MRVVSPSAMLQQEQCSLFQEGSVHTDTVAHIKTWKMPSETIDHYTTPLTSVVVMRQGEHLSSTSPNQNCPDGSQNGPATFWSQSCFSNFQVINFQPDMEMICEVAQLL